MDLTESIAPKSDQLNADDLMAGPRTVTISEVNQGTVEQPVNVVLAEFGPGRPYKPSKSMRRVMVAAWGKEAALYAGRRMTLYRDPEVKFGGEKLGGIKISHLSHIEKAMNVDLTVAKGRRAPHRVQPLADAAPAPDYLAQIESIGSKDALKELWRTASAAGHMTDELNATIVARVAEVEASEPDPDADQ